MDNKPSFAMFINKKEKYNIIGYEKEIFYQTYHISMDYLSFFFVLILF